MNFNLNWPQAAVISSLIVTTGITGGIVNLGSDKSSPSKNYATINFDGGYTKIGVIYDERVYSEATVEYQGQKECSGDFEDIKSCLERSIAKGKTAEDTDLLAGVKITASTGIEYSGSRQSFQLRTETWSKTSTDSDKINVAETISKFDEMLAKTKKERKKTSKSSISLGKDPGSSNEYVNFLEKLLELGNNYLPY